MNSLDVATCVHRQAINKANLQKCPDRFNRVLDVVFFEDVFGSMGTKKMAYQIYTQIGAPRQNDGLQRYVRYC